MTQNIKAVERTAFQQQAKTVKASPTAGTLCDTNNKCSAWASSSHQKRISYIRGNFKKAVSLRRNN
ncbi:MAG: hypothetical protein LBH82_03635 [Bacteroidales bacterium]|jgi:hypothetical protein|nr:hypothetical protein [Bacteroidales bacterium]